MKKLQDIENRVLNRIYGYGRGNCFTPDRFLDLGSDEAIRKGLSRLETKGTIRRVCKGVYEYPKLHKELGVLPTNIKRFIDAISLRDNIQVQPSGAFAANLLGLSEQVPALIVYLTDGRDKNLKIGKRTIKFKRTSNKAMAVAGTTSGLVFEALKFIGKDNLSEQMISKIRKKLTEKDKAKLLIDMKFAPIWMHKILRSLVET